jgi:hypothetical protein
MMDAEMMRILPAAIATLLMATLTHADDELPVLVRSFAAAEEGAAIQEFEDGKFVPRRGETIAFLGGTDTFHLQRYPDLEMRIHRAWPDHQLRIRNLGWQGDTVFQQARPRFFYTKVGDPLPGSSPDTRERTEVGIIVMNFGKSESLAGSDGLTSFLEVYGELIDQLIEHTGSRRIVLQLPTPFFDVGPAASLSKLRNLVLEKYAEGIRQLATQRGLPVIDCLKKFLNSEMLDCSDNGVHLNEIGQRRLAEEYARLLRFPAATETPTESYDLMRQAILRRNRLWQQYYHPTNWAFLFGDRQHVPASRDHIDTNKRWFVEELDTLPKLIAEAEADVHRYAGGGEEKEK